MEFLTNENSNKWHIIMKTVINQNISFFIQSLRLFESNFWSLVCYLYGKGNNDSLPFRAKTTIAREKAISYSDSTPKNTFKKSYFNNQNEMVRALATITDLIKW
jgi:hypothetical protein